MTAETFKRVLQRMVQAGVVIVDWQARVITFLAPPEGLQSLSEVERAALTGLVRDTQAEAAEYGYTVR